MDRNTNLRGLASKLGCLESVGCEQVLFIFWMMTKTLLMKILADVNVEGGGKTEILDVVRIWSVYYKLELELGTAGKK